MKQAPKKRRRLPKNILEKSDAEAVEKLFGKRVKLEFDRLANSSIKKA